MSQGHWQVDYPQALTDGTYTVDVQLWSASNALLAQSTATTLTIATPGSTPPLALDGSSLADHSIALTAISPDDGISTSDFKTSIAQLVFSGTSDAPNGSHVVLSIDGTLYHTTVEQGSWRYNHSGQSLTTGSHQVQVSLVDAAGNLAISSAVQEVVIDNTSLSLSSKTTGAIAQTANLQMLFSDDVNAVAGKVITIFDETLNRVLETIDVTDTNRVSINGREVIVNPANDLVVPHAYHALVDAGAFVSTRNMAFAGVSSASDWLFHAVDPATTVTLTGTGVDARDGVNADELLNLTLSGTVVSPNISAVSQLAIGGIRFVSADGQQVVEVPNAQLPLIDPTTLVWTLPPDNTWLSQLHSDTRYHVEVELLSEVSGTPTQSVAQSSSMWVDTVAPELNAVSSDSLALNSGQSATYTLTFSEDPGTSLSASDFLVSEGTIVFLSSTGTTRQVVFTPNANVTLANALPVQLSNVHFTDAAGNVGSVAAGVNWPTLQIDTALPSVSEVVLSGADGTSGADKTGTLHAGDILRATLQMSEAVSVMGVPTYRIDLGGLTKTLSYVSGTQALVFEYTIQAGDLDSVGGITASANALSLNGGHITDAAGNNALIATPAIFSNENTWVIDGGASPAAIRAAQLIQSFAENNADPNQLSGTVPTLQDYADAGVTGVSAGNLDALNSALAGAQIGSAEVDTQAELQVLVNAYAQLQALADGNNNTPTANNPGFAQYALIGVQGVNAVRARLLGDVIDVKSFADIDSVPKVQALADAVAAVMDAAQGGNTLSRAQLNLLGLANVTDDNLPAVLRAIQNTADDGSGVDTLAELQTLVNNAVNNAASALAVLQDFAEQNTQSLTPNGGGYADTPPTLQHYLNAGVVGATSSNWRALNDALATAVVDGNRISTCANLQTVVDGYLALIGLADGFGNTPSEDAPSASAYSNIGVSGVTASDTHHLSLLADVIDRKTYADIDTVYEVQALADNVDELLDTAAGDNALTLSQLQALGFTNVSANQLADVKQALQDTADDGSEVDTYAELSSVITNKLASIQQALQTIATYAQVNTQSAPNMPQGTAPSVSDYANAGVKGVTAFNLDAINDALTTASVTEASVNTTLEVQALVDAYRLVINAADGAATAGVTTPTAAQYNLLGLTGLDPSLNTSAPRTSLLSEVIDRKTFSDVNTIAQLQALLNSVINVMNAAKGVSGLSLGQLQGLGITGVTDDNFALVMRTLSATQDDGSEVDTFSELQDLISTAVTQSADALQVIQNYADNNTNASTSVGTPPTLLDYQQAGVVGVTAAQVDALNSALATPAVNAARVNSIGNLQDVVDAYLSVFSMADGVDNTLTANNLTLAYSVIGVTGVDNASAYSLLGDVIDVKQASDVNSTVKIQALADAVQAVLRAATGGTDLTQAQLASLTITGLTADNFPLVLKALNNVPTSLERYDTRTDLQALVSGVVVAANAALQTIGIYADSNTASAPATPSGVAPILSTYTDAGVSGVNNSNLAAINDALTTSAIISTSVNTTVKVQTLVDAYNAVFALADGIAGNAGAGQAITLTQLGQLGINTAAMSAASNASTRLSLLNNVLDAQSASGVDTVNEIQRLYTLVNAVQDQAAGITPSPALTATDFATLGVSGVSSANLAAFLSGIAATNDDGTQVNTQAKLQTLFNSTLTLALTDISTDSGHSSSDLITNDNTLTLSGTTSAQDGSVVKLTLTPSAGNAIVTTTTVSNGAWQATLANALSDGTYSVSTELLNASNSVIRSASVRSLTVDTSDSLLADGSNDTLVAGKTIDFTDISPDTGFSSSDFKTSAAQLIFNGTSDASDGAHVALSIDGLLHYTTVQNGAWSFDNTANTPLVSGTHKVQAFLIDTAGNVAASSVARDVVVDDSNLTITSKTSGAIAQTANLVLVFSDSVTARTGKYITIYDNSTQQAYETIDSVDPRVSISGNTVTINPANDLVLGKTYYATIDRGAFVSSSGMLFNGLLNITAWTFNPVDPSTTVLYGGVGVDASDGINATELSNLTVTGTVSSTNNAQVSNLEITKITFTPSDNSAPIVLTTGMPVVDDNTRVWTLANNNSWTSQLVSGKRYTVSVQLEADVGGTHAVSVANSAASLLDTASPTLSISSSATTLKAGESATLTFTFSEPPAGFTQSDIVVATQGGNAIGSLSNFAVTADSSVYTVVFTPNADLILNGSLVSVVRTRYTDEVGNAGAQDASSPAVDMDTAPPSVSSIAISGVDASNSPKASDLLVGDKIKITLNMSEATTVSGTPSVTFDVGGQSKTALYASGSGSTALVFYYTVVLGDTDNSGGITALANALSLNGGTLRDAFGNDAALATSAVVPNTNSVVVETNANALAALATAAQNNSASAVNTPLTLFERAGATGVTPSNLSAINSALNSAAVVGTQVDTLAELQSVVDAYRAVLALADGAVSVGTEVSATQFAAVGVTGIASTTPNAASVAARDKASLLSTVIDRKQSTAVDTVAEIQTLADAVTAVMQAANGVTSGGGALTKAQLEALGITGVTDNNLTEVLAKIDSTPDDGSSVNSLSALQYVVDQAVNATRQAALTAIGNFAADNTSSAPVSGNASYVGTAPTLRDYANAGVTGVDNTNLASINDALATNSVNRAAVDTTAEIQALVNAYSAVFALADGVANSGTALSAAQLVQVGVNLGNAATLSGNLALLNNVLDPKSATDVDRVSDINALASITNAIQDSVGNMSASNALTASDFSAIGLSNVNSTNLTGIRESIANQSAANKVDTLQELQALIDFYALNPLTISLTNDTGQSSSDTTTNDIALTFGAPSAGASRYYSVDGSVYSNVYTAPTSQGSHTVAIRQISSQGYWGQSSSVEFDFDSQAPSTWDLNTNVAGTQSTDDGYFNFAQQVGGKQIAANVGTVSDLDVVSISISVSGVGLDSANDRLLFGTVNKLIDTTASSGNNITINGVSGLDYSYSSSKVLTLSKHGGGALSASDIQKIEQGVSFITSSNTQGNRSFALRHTDLAGNTSSAVTTTLVVDTQIAAVDLISGQAGTQNTERSYINASQVANGKALFANMAATTESDIAKIIVSYSDTNIDTSNDKLLFGTIVQSLNGLDANGVNQTIGGISNINWEYKNKVLTLSKSSGAFNANDVQAIEKALMFGSATNATQGDRTFILTHQDSAGNQSASGTETLTVDTQAPAAPNVQRVATGDGTPITGNTNLTTPVVRVSLSSTGAVAGDTVLLKVNAAINTSVVLLAADISNGYVDLTTTALTDGSKTFSSQLQDMAGNSSAFGSSSSINIDTIAPLLIDLDTTTAGVQSTETRYYGNSLASTGSALVPNMGLSSNTDIDRISVSLGGTNLTVATDKLVIDTTEVALNSDNNANGVTLNTVSGMKWTYNSTSKVLTLERYDGYTLTAAEIQKIQTSLKFKTAGNVAEGERTFTFGYTDLFGNTNASGGVETLLVDYTAPTLDLDTADNTTVNRGVTNVVANTAVSLTNGSSSSVTESNGKLSNLLVKVRGLIDGSNEKLMVGSTEINANGSATSGSVTVSSTTWNWTYSSASSAFTFALSNSALATTAQVLVLMQALSYKNVSATPSDGVRQFLISATDAAGNTTSDVSASMGINLSVPQLASVNPMTSIDGNNDGVRGDQFVISFSELVKSANITNTSNWSGPNLGVGATIQALDTINVNGTDYATNFLVKTGTSPTVVMSQSKAFTLNGGSSTSTTASYLTLPRLTINEVITIELWVNIDSTSQGNYARFVDLGENEDLIGTIKNNITQTPDNNIWLGMRRATGKIELEVWSGSTSQLKLYTSNTYSGWHHVAGVISTQAGTNPNTIKKTLSIYVDGSLAVADTSESDTGTADNLTAIGETTFISNFVGKSNWLADGYFKGDMYDVRVYNDVRTATEIANDMKGAIDVTDPNLKLYYPLDGSYDSGLAGGTKATEKNADLTTFSSTEVGNATLTIDKTNVIDTNNTTASSNQSVTLLKNGGLSGTAANDTLTGSGKNDFLVGHGGNDSLTGGNGADIFAWQLGDTGSDSVTDFQAGQGDMVDLSGLLSGIAAGNLAANLNNYVRLTNNGTHMVLGVDVSGGGNINGSTGVGTTQTITFSNGLNNGLNDTLVNLVTKKIINLNLQSATPLVLDLNGDGVHTQSVDEGVAFDIIGNGQAQQTGWTDGVDGFLALDRNSDGLINNGSELFGSATRLADNSLAPNGFAALRQHDSNTDGQIDMQDSVFAQLKLWVDANRNGQTDAGELHALSDFNIAALHLGTKAVNQQDQGNAIQLISTWTDTQGRTHDLADVWFTTTSLKTPLVEPQQHVVI